MSVDQKEMQLPKDTDWVRRVQQKSIDHMKRFESCSQSVLVPFMEELGINNPLLVRAAGALHGGLMSSQVCGVYVGNMMILGLFLGREDTRQGLDGLIPILTPAARLMKRLHKNMGAYTCKDLTGYDFSDLNQAIAFYSSPEREKCVERVGAGVEITAALLVQLDENGELFRPLG
jgi:C_GCAxxG_C_C family probable redox protein